MPTRHVTMCGLVKTEAANLLKEATKEELEKLNLETFSSSHHRLCIYGQMTGDCFSERAELLISKCAPKIYVGEESDNDSKLSPMPESGFSHANMDISRFSPIEVFIMDAENNLNGNIARLIEYLKGVTTKLILR